MINQLHKRNQVKIFSHWEGQRSPSKMVGMRTVAVQCWTDFKEIPHVRRQGETPARWFSSVQFSSVTQSCPILCDPMNLSTPGFPVHHKLPEFTQTHVHRVSDAIQLSHPLSSPSPPAPNPSQHQGLFQWVNSSHEVAKVLEFQLQHQSLQWTPKTYLL